MQTLLSKLEVKTCQNQMKSCKKSQLQALCVDPKCAKNRNLCISCIKDHEDHSMIDYAQLIDLLGKEEQSNNEFKKLALQVEKQFKHYKSIILKELEDQEQKLRNYVNQIKSQYTTFDIFQQLTKSNSKLTQAHMQQIGTRLSAFLIEKQQGEREFYEIKQVEFEKTDQYFPIQAILSRLAFSTHYLSQCDQNILLPQQIQPLDCYQQFTQLKNSLQIAEIYHKINESTQQQLRNTLIEKAENLNFQLTKSIQELKGINCQHWLLKEHDLLSQLNITNLVKSNFKDPIQLDGHKNQIGAVAISQNEEFIASGDWDGLIILWRLQNKQQVQQFKSETEVYDLQFSNDNKLLAAAQFEKPYNILLYDMTDINSNEPKIRLKGHTSTIRRIQFTQNSTQLISGSHDKTLKIWNLSNSTIVFELTLSNKVNDVCISSNEQFISACCEDGKAYLFDSSSLEQLKQLTVWQAHEEKAFCTTLTPDAQIILTASKEIKLWSITQLLSNDENKIPVKIFQGSSWFQTIKIFLNGQIMISNDGQIKIWNLKTDQLICQLDVPGGYQYSDDKTFEVTQNLNSILTGGKNCKLKIFEY